MIIPVEVQRAADERAGRWWAERGENEHVRVARVRAGARFLSLAINNLAIGDVPDACRRTLLHAVAAVERLQQLPDRETFGGTI